LWHFGSQLFSQAASQQPLSQAFSQQATFSQAFGQAFSQQATFSQAFGQAFSQQAGSGQQPFSPQVPLSQQVPLHSNMSFKPANMSRTGVAFAKASRTGVGKCFLQVLSQPSFSQAGSQQATFSQAFGQAFSQQATFSQGAGQAFSQQATFSHGATLAHALHSPQPPLFSPSKPFRSSKPNPWLHRTTLTRSVPKIVLRFIEQQLLYTVYCARAVEPILSSILPDPVA
jgi:hypothetical protein